MSFDTYASRIAEVLGSHRETMIRPGYISLEGLPAAGKTTTIQTLGDKGLMLSELRMPPGQENTVDYLRLEQKRAAAIASTSGRVVSDRSVWSTLTFRGAEVLLGGPVNATEISDLFASLASEGAIRIPGKVLYLDIPVEESRRRQAIRNRDILEGRIWYDPDFLQAFSTAGRELLSIAYDEDSLVFIDTLRLNEQETARVVLEEVISQ